MKIAFVWTGFTSYMADCWRELAGRKDVELKIWIEQMRNGNIAFKPEELMWGLDYQWKYSDEIGAAEQARAEDEIAAFAPAVLFVCGWARNWPPYLAKSPRLARIPKVLCCDMPWEWKMRKFSARFILWRHLRRFRKILVPGKRAAIYGRWLGFRAEDVVRGEYAIDTRRFARVELPCRVEEGKRRGFVFAGRLVGDKSICVLARAYRRYRGLAQETADIWPLDVYGQGVDERYLRGIAGVTLHGFTQPEAFPAAFTQAGAFVLASRWDPWPLVILESCAAGLPVICTDHCWNHRELIHENGTVVPAGDVEALAQAMLTWSGDSDLSRKGAVGRALASKYSCSVWANRIMKLTKELADER